MSKGQKTITHHEFPVITIHQIGKQYNVSGMDVRHAKAKLEALGYIKPIRKGSHTYELLRELNNWLDIPDTLVMLDEEYVNAKFTYILPDDYPAILQTLADILKEVTKLSDRNLEQPIKDKYTAAKENMRQALDDLGCIDLSELPAKRKFVCIPIHDTLRQGISRQKRLENIINLLNCVYDNLYRSMNFKPLYMLRYMASAIDLLKEVTIPSTIQERNKAKCAES